MSPAFPERGLADPDILEWLAAERSRDLAPDGRAFAFVYDAGEPVRALARDAFAACMGANGLDPTVYPSVRAIERRLVRACLDIARAKSEAVGTATAGGTESVMLAVKSARDHARAARGVARPKMLLPETAHASFHKAAHYLGVEVVPVAVGPDFRALPEDAKQKMDENVVLVVGSAPSYAHGVVDPIPELAQIARDYGALCHVDACVGGLVLPFLRHVRPVPEFDLSVEGVTSLSMDLHKYGFAPKGASVLLMARPELRDAHYFACAQWSGYAIVNSTTLGSKSVAAHGAALAVLLKLGRQGFSAAAEKTWAAAELLMDRIERAPGLSLLARPDMPLVAFTTAAAPGRPAGDVFELADRLAAEGWYVQPTYRFGSSPAHIHLTLNPQNAAQVEVFAADLERLSSDLSPAEGPEEMAALFDGLTESSIPSLMAGLGITEGRLPERSAPIHRLLDAAPPPVRERLLSAFVGALFS